MVTRNEVAAVVDASVGMLVDSVRHQYIFGTVEDVNTLMVTGDAQILFYAPYRCKLTQCIIRADTLETTDSSDEELNVVKAASGTAVASGTEVITTVDPVSDMTAATNHVCTVLTAANVNVLDAGDILALRVTGTINELKGVAIAMQIERLN